ncbi:hypothetical protein [Achromobacter marplatensis]|uniref:hypothetical protein n=1 Tax=Achromobacter marplatensis TaxID=470868 RepID=UPI00131EDF5F|nr:hypothetical protein [Achromobacter marplatensis]
MTFLPVRTELRRALNIQTAANCKQCSLLGRDRTGFSRNKCQCLRRRQRLELERIDNQRSPTQRDLLHIERLARKVMHFSLANHRPLRHRRAQQHRAANRPCRDETAGDRKRQRAARHTSG